VFETIRVDLPVLKQGIRAILSEGENLKTSDKKTIKKGKVP